MKLFNEKNNVGTTKYLINFHDGVKTHNDGSPFYDVALFQNKRKKQQFVKKLLKDGYVERSAITTGNNPAYASV
jgi:hypothetical protein